MNQPHADWLATPRPVDWGWTTFDRAGPATRCGGKAFNLGRMGRAGLPVPEGGVLGVEVLEAFLDGSGLSARIEARLEGVDAGDGAALARVEANVRAWFAATPWPPVLAEVLDRIALDMAGHGTLIVRSSAVGEDDARASCAGLMDSVLNVVPGDSLARAIGQVWASRWSARALAYERSGRGVLGAMAVIVQRQIAPSAAGVLFTRNPEPGRADTMLCEYCRRLADQLVAGAVDPARLRIARDARRIERLDRGNDFPDLDEATVRSLAAAGRSVEALFGTPQDIEFAVESDGSVWLVQARPITVPADRRAGRRIVWSNANVNENFPAPISPLLYSIVAPGYSAYFGNLGRAFGLAPRRLARMRRDLAGIVGVQGGRLYYNLTAIHAVLAEAPFGHRLCAWFDDFTGAADPAAGNEAHGDGFVRNARDAWEACRIAMCTARQYLGIERRVRAFERRIDDYAAAAAPDRLSRLDDLAIRDLLRGFMSIRLHQWTDASLADAAAMVCYGVLKALVRLVPGTADAVHVHNDLLKGLSGLKSAESVEALWRLAQEVRDDPTLQRLFDMHDNATILARLDADPALREFAARFSAYVECWGFRCSGELMLTVPSFQEDPAALLDIVRGYAAQADTALTDRLARQRLAREEATNAVLDAARQRRVLPVLTLAPIARRVLAATQASIGLRERARFKQALLYSRLRRIALEAGRRLALKAVVGRADDVFFLGMDELDQVLSGLAMFPEGVRPLVALRREAHARFGDAEPPDILIGTEGEYPVLQTGREPASGSSTQMRGASVCGGEATGPARVLTDVTQTRSIRPGDVLVTRQTDPGWAPAFVAIGGLVLERGGMLSHGAILAREYGIPTVVGVSGATERIATGSVVRVDGDRGEVHLVAA